uniref:Uncharacterized protein n=1 Tax=Candidatus Kentrum sp. TUN TaxID=2126343 RepID=A0A451AIY6_9GAMM|nr:MAG: hypothetical protein BECKTUN1418E_GA0071001_111814 [Candidatus Kentron sp. TUN]
MPYLVTANMLARLRLRPARHDPVLVQRAQNSTPCRAGNEQVNLSNCHFERSEKSSALVKIPNTLRSLPLGEMTNRGLAK